MSTLMQMLTDTGLALPDETCGRLEIFLDELLRWNTQINLTAITGREEALEKHLVDALTVLPLLVGNERLLDLGSGGGVPGLPLKLARNGLDLLSVDAVAKKILFQRQVARKLKLTGFEAWHGRAEDVPGRVNCRDSFDVVISRAFASLTDFARLARPCLRPGGWLIAMKGPEGEREQAEAETVLRELHLLPFEIRSVRLPRSRAIRSLIVLKKEV
ncbi:MAG: 16S rRNA (guanine(527)-N(7))-methyltransferase RsmG [Desulfuromonadales bacterium GWD2_61_12]|nr:MAG: 16S rRNA (guanine(527)-N(7))-methyltransferase RsmG [Desulfuromonadales bacterium GWD2_61_12]